MTKGWVDTSRQQLVITSCFLLKRAYHHTPFRRLSLSRARALARRVQRCKSSSCASVHVGVTTEESKPRCLVHAACTVDFIFHEKNAWCR